MYTPLYFVKSWIAMAKISIKKIIPEIIFNDNKRMISNFSQAYLLSKIDKLANVLV